MELTAILLLAVYIGLAGWMFSKANSRFSHHDRLPMQWGLNKQPNWYAPRRFALGMAPLLGGIAFIIAALAMAFPSSTRVADKQTTLTLLVLGIFGIFVYAGYIWLVGQWDRNSPGITTKDS